MSEPAVHFRPSSRVALSSIWRSWIDVSAISYLKLLLGGTLWFFASVFIFLEALTWPYIGAEFSPGIAGQSIVVDHVRKGSPAEAAGLQPGDEIVSITDISGRKRALTGLEAISSRHEHHSFEMTNEVRSTKAEMWKMLNSGPLTFETRAGQALQVDPFDSRPTRSLPSSALLLTALSLVITLIVTGILTFAPISLPVFLLTLSGFGIIIIMFCDAVASIAELSMPPQIYLAHFVLNGTGTIVFAYSLLALLWHFPSAPTRFPFGTFTLSVAAFVIVAQNLQLFEFWPNPYQAPNLLVFVAGSILCAFSWQRTRNDPVQRASVMWFLVSIVGVSGLVVLFFVLPALLGLQTVMTPVVGLFALSFIFIGIAFGTLRYRLFDIQQIWWRTVIWAVGGATVILVDLLLISQFNFKQQFALPLALLMIGWVYFPIRQFIFERFLISHRVNIASEIPKLITHFSGLDDPEEFNGRFLAFLKNSFDAKEFGRVNHQAIDEAIIEDNGLSLRVPNVFGTQSVQLVGKTGGRQLFSTDDARFVNMIYRLVRYMGDAGQRELARLRQDRARIVRDLHDDVGSKLLSIIHGTEDGAVAGQARETLTSLKDTLVVIEDTQTMSFKVSWHTMTKEALERLNAAGLEAEIRENIQTERVLSAREHVNFKRIMQEVVSNVVKYASGGKVTFDLSLSESGSIKLVVSNKFDHQTKGELSSERGLPNMLTRLEEIGGSVDISDTDGTYRTEIYWPM